MTVRYANDLMVEPSPEPTAREACRAVARLSKQLELALAEVDLTLPQYRALAFLERGDQAPSTLAGLLAVSRPTITALVDGLVARGFVERHPDASDRRRVEHRLTPAGAGALAAADTVAATRLSRLADHLEDPATAPEAILGLTRWHAAIDRTHQAARPAVTGPTPTPDA